MSTAWRHHQAESCLYFKQLTLLHHSQHTISTLHMTVLMMPVCVCASVSQMTNNFISFHKCCVVAVHSAIWLRHHPLHGVVSVHLQILLVGTCRRRGWWSVAGHNHRKVIGQDPVCADLHCMGVGPSGNNFAETMCGYRTAGSITLEWLTTEADDQSSLHCVVVSTGAMSDHTRHRHASRGDGCSKTSAFMINNDNHVTI